MINFLRSLQSSKRQRFAHFDAMPRSAVMPLLPLRDERKG